MINSSTLRRLDKNDLLRDFSDIVDKDRHNTAALVAYIAEIDRRKLYLEHACPSMFAFCTSRFHMSEAIAAKRIRAGRAAYRFPYIFDMIARGELHLTGVHQLAAHLTEENYGEVLQRAKHKSMREIEKLIAEISPKPDVPTLIRALPTKKSVEPSHLEPVEAASSSSQPTAPAPLKPKAISRPVPLAPRRYKLQVTIGEEARDKLAELQALLSHQIPNGDPGEILERDEGQCAFVDAKGRRCPSKWQVEFHHRIPHARGGTHDIDNIEFRCRAHNQYEAELEYGPHFMAMRRYAPDHAQSGRDRD